MVVKKKKLLKSRKKKIVLGIVHINSTFNNTIVTVTDLYGNTIAWASAGSVGFKGPVKELHLLLRLQQRKLYEMLLSWVY